MQTQKKYHPASFSQKRLWFLEKLEPNNSAYNIIFTWNVKGDTFCKNTLSAAIDSLIERHEALRTSFHSISGEIVQNISAPFHLNIFHEDINTNNCDQRIEEFSRETYDFSTTPLMKVLILEKSFDERLLCFSFHHIICDGWSLDIFFKELSIVYNAKLTDRPVELPVIKKTYVEYVENQEKIIHNSNIDDAALYWKNSLHDLSHLAIPTDFPKPAQQSFEGNREIIFLTSEITTKLNEKARETNNSLYTILVSAYVWLLQILTNQNDIIIGTPVANRLDHNLKDTIGFFVNSIIIRCQIPESDNLIFKDFLKLIKDNFLEALEYQNYPFEKVVELIQPDRALSHNPLFQVMFALQNTNKTVLDLDKCICKSQDPNTGITRFDLETTIWEKEEGLKIRINYNKALYNTNTIKVIIQTYAHILSKIAYQAFDDLQVTNKIIQDLPEKFLSIHYGEKIDLPSDSVIDILFKNSQQYEKQLAILYDKEKITYGDLNKKTLCIATYLNTFYKESSSNNVVLVLDPSMEMAIIVISVLRSRLTLVPISPKDPLQRKLKILESIKPLLVISDQEIDQSIPRISAQNLIIQAINNKDLTVNSSLTLINNVAYIIHTSGTTGTPKGVCVEHSHLLNTIFGSQKSISLDSSDIFACWSNYSFDIFYFELLLPLISGATVRLVNIDTFFGQEDFMEVFQKITCMQAVPGLMQQLIDQIKIYKDFLPHVRYALTGGDLVPPALLVKLANIFPSASIQVLYGPTEASIICCQYIFNKNDQNQFRNIIGHPLPNVEIRICDAHTNLVPKGVIGEILIGGKGVAQGYLNQKELNDNVFIYINNKKFYKTGDKGKISFDGQIDFFGRDDTQIKLRGFRINLDEISYALSSHQSVDKAATILYKNKNNFESIISYVVLNEKHNGENNITLANNWKQLFDDTHKINKEASLTDFSGWKSAVDNIAFSQEIMHDWLASTIKTILLECDENKTKNKELKILEIGCGTGLVLFKMLPYCKKYIGTDISQSIVSSLKKKIKSQEHVTILQCAAHEVHNIINEKFDVIILNSVIQYFPSANYLRSVVCNIKNLLSDTGFIFFGDIRAKYLSDYLYREVVNYQLDEKNNDEVEELIASERFYDNELLVDPKGLIKISYELNMHAEIFPRIDQHNTELSRYRYNAILINKKSIDINPVNWQQWTNVEDFLEYLSGKNPQHNFLGFYAIPNKRFFSSENNESYDPYQLMQLGEKFNRSLRFGIENSAINGDFELVFSRYYQKDMPLGDDNKYFSCPSEKIFLKSLEIEIMEHLGETLPRHMLPRQIEFIHKLPLGKNDKVDKKLFPIPRLIKKLSQYLPPQTPLQKKIYDAWVNILGITNISINDNFFSLGGTSLLAIQLSIQMRKMEINLRPQVIFKCQTINEISNFISKQHQKNILKAGMVYNRDTFSFKEVVSVQNSLPYNISSVIFFGATGFLGAYIINELLHTETCQEILCVVRPHDEISSFERIVKTIEWYFPTIDKNLFSKIKTFEGCLKSEKLGLSSLEWDMIGKSFTIINAAANVSHVGDRDEFISTNVTGTKRIVELAEHGTKKKIIHISSIGVKGLQGDKASYTELDLDNGQSFTENYSESKFLAEVVLNEYKKKGGDVLIFRVGTISPCLTNGLFQKNINNHFFSRYVKSIIQMRVAPHWINRKLSFIPVDVMAKMVLQISKENTNLSTFHINSSIQVSYYEINLWLQKAGYEVNIISEDEFEKYVNKLTQEKSKYLFLEGIIQLLDSKNLEHIHLETNRTDLLLKEIGIDYPNVDAKWFDKFIQYGIKLGYFPNPQ